MDKAFLIEALGEIAGLINAEQDTDTILKQLIFAACRHVNWLRGSIMSVDLESGYAYVTVRYDPTLLPFEGGTEWALTKSPSLIALRHNEPVFIRDAKIAAEFPGFQKESVERDYSSVLVMPMSVSDIKGRPIVLTVVSREVRDLSPEDLSLMKLIVQFGTIALEKQKTIRLQQQLAEQNRDILLKHIQWIQQALSDESVPNLVARMNRVFQQPLLVVDYTTNTVHCGKTPNESLFSDTEWHSLVETDLKTKIRNLVDGRSTPERWTVSELTYSKGQETNTISFRGYYLGVDGNMAGVLVLLGDSDIYDTDLLLIESAKQALSVQLMRNMIRFRFEQRTLNELFTDIIAEGAKDIADILRRALKYGINLLRAHRMIIFSFAAAEKISTTVTMNIHRDISLAVEQMDPPASVVVRDTDIIVWIGLNTAQDDSQMQKTAKKMLEYVKQYTPVKPVAVVSGVCRHPEEYPSCFRKVKDIVKIANSLGKRGVVQAEELGPLGMLLVSADPAYVRAFAEKKLGAMLKYDADNDTNFFETLKSLIDSGFRSQRCADYLNIHVTTLRYRLTRIQDLFDVNLQNNSSRFEIEMAVRLVQLVSSNFDGS